MILKNELMKYFVWCEKSKTTMIKNRASKETVNFFFKTLLLCGVFMRQVEIMRHHKVKVTVCYYAMPPYKIILFFNNQSS